MWAGQGKDAEDSQATNTQIRWNNVKDHLDKLLVEDVGATCRAGSCAGEDRVPT